MCPHPLNFAVEGLVIKLECLGSFFFNFSNQAIANLNGIPIRNPENKQPKRFNLFILWIKVRRKKWEERDEALLYILEKQRVRVF